MPDLVIHILNYRTPVLTLDCLASLAEERRGEVSFEVWLIDNASGDDSVPRIREALRERGWDSWVRFEALEENLGFAGGNNYLIRKCLQSEAPPVFQLLLNSDTRVHAGAVSKSVAWMRAHPGAGAFSCMLRNEDGSVQNVCRKFPRPDRETVRALGLPYAFPRLFAGADLEDPGWDREGARDREVEWIGGAFLLARTEAIREAGVMDDSFFFYGEDTEWCYRFRAHGWGIYFDPGPEITHLGGGSSDPSRLLDRRKEILLWKARFRVQRQCYGRVAAAWIRAVYVCAFAMRVVWLWWTGQRHTLKYRSIRSGLRTLTHPLDPERV